MDRASIVRVAIVKLLIAGIVFTVSYFAVKESFLTSVVLGYVVGDLLTPFVVK